MPKCVVRNRQTGRYILARNYTHRNGPRMRSDEEFLDVNNARIYENVAGAKTSVKSYGQPFNEARWEIVPITVTSNA